VNGMKTGWLLYDRGDYEVNRLFAEHIQKKAEPIGLSIQVVLTETLRFEDADLPDFVISRQRNHRLSQAFEQAGIPVFNSSRVCKICNDKRNTHRFLEGFPQMKTVFIDAEHPNSPQSLPFPLVVKPATGHGGDRVSLVENESQLQAALADFANEPALLQELASNAGRDLRVYVLFGHIVAGVMRTARSGIVSNFKRGGDVALHTLTDAEAALAQAVIRRFEEQGAPLSFAGIDFLYHNGNPVMNEVEDVVGSRMLYQVSDIDIIDLYIIEIARRLS